MHPASSVIIFSTLSGAGFGLLAFLGTGFVAVTGLTAFWYFVLAYLLAVGGLLASTFHLGHPERALKAFSQWRSSWLSREGISAVATLVIMALYGAGLVFFDQALVPLGILGAAGALFTVLTTAMIYTQMKTVPRWRHWSTPVLFVTLAVTGGAIFGGLRLTAMVLLVLALIVQGLWWLWAKDRFANATTTIATATGLGPGTRQFSPPHTGGSYLLKEMVHVIGRKHAQRLRVIAVILGFALPLAILALCSATWAAIAAGLVHLTGVFAARWLFFAEAEHVVGLYYGRPQ